MWVYSGIQKFVWCQGKEERGKLAPQLKPESIDKSGEWESHFPGILEQNAAWRLPVGFLKQRGMVSRKRKTQNVDFGC